MSQLCIKNVMTYETLPGDCVQSSSEDDQTDLDDDEEDDINDDPRTNTKMKVPRINIASFASSVGSPSR